MTKDEALKLALEALEKITRHFGFNRWGESRLADTQARGDAQEAITALREALAEQPAPVAEPRKQEPDRVKFERHWRKTRGEKKANRELSRHPLQPQTYIQDSANRHWVTWQAAVMSVAPPAQEIVCSTGLCHYRKPLTNMQRQVIRLRWQGRNWSLGDIIDAVEELHGIKENT